jgi:hypothetical protein
MVYTKTSLIEESAMYYVYVYKDPRPSMLQQVVYVGKGVGRRAWAHWGARVVKNKGFGHFLAVLRQKGLAPTIEIVQEFEDEGDAHAEEIRLITLYGRRDLKTGALFNLTVGGEGICGTVRTEEWSNRIRLALLTDENKSRNAKAAAKRWADPGYKEKTTIAIRKALADPAVASRREAAKALFIHTKEFRATMHKATKKMWGDSHYRDKVLVAQKEAHRRPEVKAKKSKTSKELWNTKGGSIKQAITLARNTPESKAKTSKQATEQWADASYREMQTKNNKEISNRAEVVEARKANAKALWADPVWRVNMLAARATKKEAREAIKTPCAPTKKGV